MKLPTKISRRDMLQKASCGFGYLAMAALLTDTAHGNTANPLAPKPPPLPARAKRVIFLCMSGGPAHLDTFDYKPQITQAAHPGSVFDFQRHGDSGLWISRPALKAKPTGISSKATAAHNPRSNIRAPCP